jgi:hypothetical protein
MDSTERRLSGLCTEEGRKYPKGARVTELVWSQSGMSSGVMAWDLIRGEKAARSGVLVGVMVRKP